MTVLLKGERWNKIKTQIKFLCAHSYCELKCTIEIKFRITFALEVNWAAQGEEESFTADRKLIAFSTYVTQSVDESWWIFSSDDGEFYQYFMIFQTDMKNSMFKGTGKHKFRIIESMKVDMKRESGRNVYWKLLLFWKNMGMELKWKYFSWWNFWKFSTLYLVNGALVLAFSSAFNRFQSLL